MVSQVFPIGSRFLIRLPSQSLVQSGVSLDAAAPLSDTKPSQPTTQTAAQRSEAKIAAALHRCLSRIGAMVDPTCWVSVVLPRIRSDDGVTSAAAQLVAIEALASILRGAAFRRHEFCITPLSSVQVLEEISAVLASPDFSSVEDPRLLRAGRSAALHLKGIQAAVVGHIQQPGTGSDVDLGTDGSVQLLCSSVEDMCRVWQ